MTAENDALEKLVQAIVHTDRSFQDVLREVIKKDLNLSIQEFASRTKIPQSTMYKLMSVKREPNLKTVRVIIQGIRRIQGTRDESFIAVIASRTVLDRIEERTMNLDDGTTARIREYPSNSIEDAIIAAIKAERDGATAIVCAPIVSTTVEKIVRLPVATIMPDDSLIRAIKLAAKKSM